MEIRTIEAQVRMMNAKFGDAQETQNWKKIYFEMLNRPNVADIDQEKAFGLKMDHLPEYLYRYQRFDSDGHSLTNLRAGKTWVANPQTFNDPFDSSINLTLARLTETWVRGNLPRILKSGGYAEPSSAEIEEILNSDNPFERIADMTWKRAGVPIPPGRREEYATKFEELMKQAATKFERNSRDALRVCCFCENATSTPMWAHYGGDHTGFCLQYQTRELVAKQQLAHMLHPVHYSHTRFDASQHISPENAPNPWIPIIAACNKSADWAYESEWRVILLSGDFPVDQLYEFVPPCRIIVGAKMSDPDIAELKGIPRLQTVPFSVGHLSRTRFAVEF